MYPPFTWHPNVTIMAAKQAWWDALGDDDKNTLLAMWGEFTRLQQVASKASGAFWDCANAHGIPNSPETPSN